MTDHKAGADRDRMAGAVAKAIGNVRRAVLEYPYDWIGAAPDDAVEAFKDEIKERLQ